MNVLYKSTRNPLGSFRTLEELITKFKECLQGRVLKAYFFGSFATDSLHPESDVDLILVVKTKKTYFERYKDFLDLLDLVPSLDLLIYTPEEFSKLIDDESSGFWKEIKTKKLQLI